MEFDWDVKNTEHVERHGVTTVEVEEVLNSDLDAELAFVTDAGEERYEAEGLTKAGRVLEVKFTYRHGKVRPITASPKDRGRITKQERKYANKTSNPKRDRRKRRHRDD